MVGSSGRLSQSVPDVFDQNALQGFSWQLSLDGVPLTEEEMALVADADGPFVLCACHRFGRSRTGAVDNFAAGGLLCGVDLETGVLGPALSNPGRGQRTLTWHDTHPDTGAAIAGTEVTGFAGLIDRLLRVCEAHPYLTYVGWDAVMTDDGPVFLEANCGSGLQLQAITPFLRNQRFARFMRDRGMTQRAPRTG